MQTPDEAHKARINGLLLEYEAEDPVQPAPDLKEFDELNQTLSEFRNNRELAPVQALKTAKETTASAGNALIAAGVPATPNPPLYSPDGSGTRDRLQVVSEGRLTLPRRALSPHKEARLGAEAMDDFYTRNPGAAQVIRATPEGQARFLEDIKALTAINHDPPSPAEALDAFPRAFEDYQTGTAKAAAEWTPALDEPRFDPASVSPALAQQVWSKLAHADRVGINKLRPAPGLLSEEEDLAFGALGGYRFIDHMKVMPYYVAHNRAEKFFGRPLTRQPVDSEDALSRLPHKGSLTYENLQPVSEHAQLALAAGREATMADYQKDAERIKQMGGLERFNDWRNKQTAAGLEALEEVAGVMFESALLGLPSVVLESATPVMRETFKAVAGAKQHWYDGQSGTASQEDLAARFDYGLKALWNRAGTTSAMSANPATKDLLEQTNETLAAFPDLRPEDAMEVSFRHHNATSTLDNILEAHVKFHDSYLNPVMYLNKLLGMDHPAVRNAASGIIGAQLEDPGIAVINLLGVSAFARNVQRLISPTKVRSRPVVLSPEAAAAFESGPTFMNTAVHTELVDVLHQSLKAMEDPAAAKGLVERLVDKAKNSDSPLIAEDLAAMLVEVDTIKQHLGKTAAATSLSDDARAALSGLDKYVASLSYFDQGLVMTGNRQTALSLSIVKTTENYLRSQESFDARLDIPNSISHKEGLAQQTALLRETHNLNDLANRQIIIEDLTGRATKQLTIKSELLNLQRTKEVKVRDHIRKSWNDNVKAWATKFFKIENAGGEVLQANPALRTKAFREIKRALDSGNVTVLTKVMLDQANWRYVFTPDLNLALKQLDSEATSTPRPDLLKTEDAITGTTATLRRLRDPDPPPGVSQTGEPVTPEGIAPQWQRLMDMSDPANYPSNADPALRAGASAAIKKAKADLLVARAEDFIRESFEPIKMQFARNPRPRLKLADAILDRISKLKPDEYVTLTEKERLALNEYRPAPIKAPTPKMVGIVDGVIKNIDDALLEAKLLKDDIEAFAKAAAAATLDTKPIKISKELGHRIAQELALLEPGDYTRLKKGLDLDARYPSLEISPGAPDLPASKAFLQAVEGASTEYKLLLEGHMKISAFEMNELRKLPGGDAKLAVVYRDFMDNQHNIKNFGRFMNHKFARELGRDVSAAEGMSILRDMADGKARTEPAAILMQKERRRHLDQQLRSGIITPEFYHSMIRSDYYHGVWDFTTQGDLADLQLKTGPLVKLRPGLKPLGIDPVQFKFKIPEDKLPAGQYYVAWKDPAVDGGINHKKGFTSPEAAGTWAESNLKDGAEVTVHKNIPIEIKTTMGLVGEAGYSTMTLNERMGVTTGSRVLTEWLSRTPHVKTYAELGIDAADPRGIVEMGKDTWVRIEEYDQVPALRGKFIHRDMTGLLEEYKDSADVLTTLGKELQEMTTPVPDNPLMSKTRRGVGLAGRALEKAIRMERNAVALTKVALSPFAMLKGRIGNMMYTWWAGMPPTIQNIARWAENEMEFHRQNITGTHDLTHKGLYKRGLIKSVSASEIEKMALKRLETHWQSATALKARIELLEADIQKAADPKAEAVLKADWHKLKGEYRTAVQTAFAKGTRSLIEGSTDVLMDIYHGLDGKPSRSNDAAWRAYDVAGGDRISKYNYAVNLQKHHGHTLEEALNATELFFQNLHRAPKFVKKLTDRFGGAQFVGFWTEQIRILSNVVRHKPAQLAKSIAMLNAFNSGMLAAQGIDEDEYLEAYAMGEGVKRSVATDTIAKLRGIMLPAFGSRTKGVMSVGMLQHAGSTFSVDSPAAKRLQHMLSGQTENPWLQAASYVTAGAISKVAGGEAAIQTAFEWFAGRDERGDPLNNVADAAASLYRKISPDLAPGNSGFTSFVRSAADQNNNPMTHEKITAGQIFLRKAGITRLESSNERLSAAATVVMKSSQNLARYQSVEKYDDLESTLVARRAMGPDGKIDHAKALAIVTQNRIDNPRSVPAAGESVLKEPSDKEIEDAALTASMSGLQRRLHRMSVGDGMATYAQWRNIDTHPDPKLERAIRDIIDSKLLKAQGLNDADMHTLRKVSELWKAKPDRLPKDALEALEYWESLAGRALLDKAAFPR